MSILSSILGIFGGGRPSSQSVMQSSRIPEEIAPYAKEVLTEAQDLYKKRMDEGYTPYTGETIAPLTQEQQEAMAGISGLVGTTAPLYDEALGITRGLGEKFTADTAREYMSPYQQAVIDIEKREAQTDFERDIMPQFEKQAVEAGGMSGMGSRAAIQAAELGGRQMERLGDIQTKGLQRAYADARQRFEQQKGREAGMASAISSAAPQKLKAGLAEYGAKQAVGQEKQALGQQALDEAYYKFLEKQAYPQEKLAEYSGFVYGNPLMSQRDVSRSSSQVGARPSMGQSLLGLGLQGLSGFGGFGGLMGGMAGGGSGISPAAGALFRSGFGGAGAYGFQSGGSVKGGIASLPVVNKAETPPGQTKIDDEEQRDDRRPDLRGMIPLPADMFRPADESALLEQRLLRKLSSEIPIRESKLPDDRDLASLGFDRFSDLKTVDEAQRDSAYWDQRRQAIRGKAIPTEWSLGGVASKIGRGLTDDPKSRGMVAQTATAVSDYAEEIEDNKKIQAAALLGDLDKEQAAVDEAAKSGAIAATRVDAFNLNNAKIRKHNADILAGRKLTTPILKAMDSWVANILGLSSIFDKNLQQIRLTSGKDGGFLDATQAEEYGKSTALMYSLYGQYRATQTETQALASAQQAFTAIRARGGISAAQQAAILAGGDPSASAGSPPPPGSTQGKPTPVGSTPTIIP